MIPYGALDRVTWDCVHFVTQKEADGISNWGQGVTIDVDLRGVDSKESLLDQVAHALRFPTTFGRNWDALVDCLRDLGSWIPADAYTVRLIGAEGLWRKVPMIAGVLVSVWLSAAEHMGTRLHKPLHLVFVF